MYLNNQLTALAIIPGLMILTYVYTKDKVEKEPISMIIKVVIFGAISCIIAGFVETFVAQFLPWYPEGSLEYALVNAFLLAAFWEEILKYLALRIATWNCKHFNYRFDGVVYGVSAAIGFAVLENILYVAQYGMSTAIVRAFTAVPLHAFCGLAMGTFYSYSKKNAILGNRAKTNQYTLLGLVVPMIIHGVYNTFAFLRSNAAAYALLVFVAIMYVIAIKTIRNLSKADHKEGLYPNSGIKL